MRKKLMVKIVAAPLVAPFMEPAWVAQSQSHPLTTGPYSHPRNPTTFQKIIYLLASPEFIPEGMGMYEKGAGV